MKDSVASMIAQRSTFTARRPDKAKHQPKVLNVVSIETKVGATVKLARKLLPHTVWRGGVQYEVTKDGLVAI